MGLEPDQAGQVGGRLAAIGGGENGTMKEALIAFPCGPDEGIVSMPEDAKEALWVAGDAVITARPDGAGVLRISAHALVGSPRSFEVAYSWTQIGGGHSQGLTTDWHFLFPGGSDTTVSGLVVLKKGEASRPNDPESVAQIMASRMVGRE